MQLPLLSHEVGSWSWIVTSEVLEWRTKPPWITTQLIDCSNNAIKTVSDSNVSLEISTASHRVIQTGVNILFMYLSYILSIAEDLVGDERLAGFTLWPLNTTLNYISLRVSLYIFRALSSDAYLLSDTLRCVLDNNYAPPQPVITQLWKPVRWETQKNSYHSSL